MKADYWPIKNLSFVLKKSEITVLLQLGEGIHNQKVMETQKTYRALFSSETALVKKIKIFLQDYQLLVTKISSIIVSCICNILRTNAFLHYWFYCRFWAVCCDPLKLLPAKDPSYIHAQIQFEQGLWKYSFALFFLSSINW